LWDNGAHIRPTLDSLIDSGQLPASIFVFLSSGGGPFVDNECIDAAGGVEAFDTFVATALVPYMDASFRTIARPAGRTLMGDSQGVSVRRTCCCITRISSARRSASAATTPRLRSLA